ncbi:tryptophan synthase alpha chain [Bacteroidia bacterium]|nr:tryptophan synthase alpha chain [Bacteroidia bacterium]
MNRIHQLFQSKPSNLLSIYFTAGFPQLSDTVSVIESLSAHGVDMIEVGIPFSDPMADGVVIQQSSQVALQNGMSLQRLFADLTGIRSKVSLPLVMMGYLNPIMQYGFEQFCKDCRRVGIDGLIIPDLPMGDYLADYKSIAEQHGLLFVFLITPATSDERIRLIDKHTNGFIYMVSAAATTGVQSSFDSQVPYFERISAMRLKNPRLIGFGISSKSTLDAACRYSSGGIVGSAFIKALSQTNSIAEGVDLLMKNLQKNG